MWNEECGCQGSYIRSFQDKEENPSYPYVPADFNLNNVSIDYSFYRKLARLKASPKRKCEEYATPSLCLIYSGLPSHNQRVNI